MDDIAQTLEDAAEWVAELLRPMGVAASRTADPRGVSLEEEGEGGAFIRFTIRPDGVEMNARLSSCDPADLDAGPRAFLGPRDARFSGPDAGDKALEALAGILGDLGHLRDVAHVCRASVRQAPPTPFLDALAASLAKPEPRRAGLLAEAAKARADAVQAARGRAELRLRGPRLMDGVTRLLLSNEGHRYQGMGGAGGIIRAPRGIDVGEEGFVIHVAARDGSGGASLAVAPDAMWIVAGAPRSPRGRALKIPHHVPDNVVLDALAQQLGLNPLSQRPAPARKP
jgi:hypothetical protein